MGVRPQWPLPQEPSSGYLKGVQALRAKRHGALGHDLCREGCELLTGGEQQVTNMCSHKRNVRCLRHPGRDKKFGTCFISLSHQTMCGRRLGNINCAHMRSATAVLCAVRDTVWQPAAESNDCHWAGRNSSSGPERDSARQKDGQENGRLQHSMFVTYARSSARQKDGQGMHLSGRRFAKACPFGTRAPGTMLDVSTGPSQLSGGQPRGGGAFEVCPTLF